MRNPLFNITKRVVIAAELNITSNPVEMLKRVYHCFEPNLPPKAIKNKILSFLCNEFNKNYMLLESLKKEKTAYPERRECVEKLTRISDAILDHHPLSSLDNTFILKASETYTNLAQMKLDMNSFLPLTEEKREADAKTACLVKKILAKASRINPENKKAGSMLGELEYNFPDLLEPNGPPSLRKE